MSLFKRKKLVEEEDMRFKFKSINREIDYLNEEVEILKTLNAIDHIFICRTFGTNINNICPTLGVKVTGEGKWLEPIEARKWAEKNGYSYVRSFKKYGELWVKREKK